MAHLKVERSWEGTEAKHQAELQSTEMKAIARRCPYEGGEGSSLAISPTNVQVNFAKRTGAIWLYHLCTAHKGLRSACGNGVHCCQIHGQAQSAGPGLPLRSSLCSPATSRFVLGMAQLCSRNSAPSAQHFFHLHIAANLLIHTKRCLACM